MTVPFESVKHVAFINKLLNSFRKTSKTNSQANEEKEEKNISNVSLEVLMAEHLKLNGCYWALTSLDILVPQQDGINDCLEKAVASSATMTISSGTASSNTSTMKSDIIKFILACQDNNHTASNGAGGGFGGSIDHDPHILYTLSAVQTLATLDSLDAIPDPIAVLKYIKSLQNEDGSFMGDEWGEVDIRFSYCAVSCITLLLAHLNTHSSKSSSEPSPVISIHDWINTDTTIAFINKCRNFDGGYGSCPGAESHAGLVFCAVGALCILDALDRCDADRLGWWLAERQLKNGGLNGRPEKLEDVCYSWWVLSSLKMLGKDHWIDKSKLVDFILAAQDSETGGIADRPGDMPDIFHTLFGIAGLSMLDFNNHDLNKSSTSTIVNLKEIDPRFCMPKYVTERLNLH